MIDIIIVNWNSGAQLCECISSILQHHNSCVSSIVIVDNNSTDDSLEQVKSLTITPMNLFIIKNTNNLGFAIACNQGAALSKSDYLLFLNPDTVLQHNSLLIPLEFMKRSENIGVGITGIQLIDEDNSVTRSCSRFPSLPILLSQIIGINRLPSLQHLGQPMTEWEHTTTRRVEQVIGAFLLIRGSLFKSLGGFDERFFVYFEEVDLSLRAYQAGWSTFYITAAQAFHSGGGTSQQVKAHRLFYLLRSRLLYGQKHFKFLQILVLYIASLVLEPITRVVFALFKGTKADVNNTLSAFSMLFSDLPNILKKALRS